VKCQLVSRGRGQLRTSVLSPQYAGRGRDQSSGRRREELGPGQFAAFTFRQVVHQTPPVSCGAVPRPEHFEHSSASAIGRNRPTRPCHHSLRRRCCSAPGWAARQTACGFQTAGCLQPRNGGRRRMPSGLSRRIPLRFTASANEPKGQPSCHFSRKATVESAG